MYKLGKTLYNFDIEINAINIENWHNENNKQDIKGNFSLSSLINEHIKNMKINKCSFEVKKLAQAIAFKYGHPKQTKR